MSGENPYQAPAGAETDQAIHQQLFADDPSPLPYSTEESAAEKIKGRIKSVFGYPVETGETRTRPRRYFARLESGPSTSTEVLANSRPLALCRLALVIAAKRNASESSAPKPQVARAHGRNEERE